MRRGKSSTYVPPPDVIGFVVEAFTESGNAAEVISMFDRMRAQVWTFGLNNKFARSLVVKLTSTCCAGCRGWRWFVREPPPARSSSVCPNPPLPGMLAAQVVVVFRGFSLAEQGPQSAQLPSMACAFPPPDSCCACLHSPVLFFPFPPFLFFVSVWRRTCNLARRFTLS